MNGTAEHLPNIFKHLPNLVCSLMFFACSNRASSTMHSLYLGEYIYTCHNQVCCFGDRGKQPPVSDVQVGGPCVPLCGVLTVPFRLVHAVFADPCAKDTAHKHFVLSNWMKTF